MHVQPVVAEQESPVGEPKPAEDTQGATQGFKGNNILH